MQVVQLSLSNGQFEADKSDALPIDGIVTIALQDFITYQVIKTNILLELAALLLSMTNTDLRNDLNNSMEDNEDQDQD